jgi:hypothetical protein
MAVAGAVTIHGSEERLWYARKAIEHGGSRSILHHQIYKVLYRRQGKSGVAFKACAPA